MAAALSKSALRQQFRQLRRRHGALAQPLIASRLPELLEPLLAPGRILGLYWPLAGEIDLRTAGVVGGWPLALPVVERDGCGPDGSAVLRYRLWDPGMPLIPDQCGIPAPPPACGADHLGPENLGLLLIPALAIDRCGVRLGSGGGWYDRLRADPAWRAVPAFAVLPAACVSEALPADSWDVPLDGWLDEGGLHRVSGPPKVASS